MTIEELHSKYIECGCVLTTDSRKIVPGCIFVALKGENFDGNAFACAALQAGAAYAVVNADSEAAQSGDARMLVFPDTLKALQDLASYHREHTLHEGKRIPMLALTGTNGKTTTKELTKAVLGTKYNLTATEGNLNNNIGVPFTLLRMTPDTELALVEMGASHPGDIKELVDIAHPDFGLITNVGKAHLLGFGSFEGVKATKGEMYDYIASVDGTCFVNTGSSDLVQMAAQRSGMKTVEYGMQKFNAKVLPSDEQNPYLSVEFEDDGVHYTVHTHLVGSYNADNVLTAIAVGKYFGIGVNDAIAAIEAYTPVNNRSQMCVTAHNTLIVDAYNANPSSMKAALDNFANVRAIPKAVCLGDMLELGAESENEHRKILEHLQTLDIMTVILVGAEFGKVAKGNDKFHCFETSEQLADFLKINKIEGFTVLIKGSRGIKMEKLIPYL